ncbi:MAG: glycogen/starch/alpha-glucan phosphorylase [Pseudomonadota bacterium]
MHASEEQNTEKHAAPLVETAELTMTTEALATGFANYLTYTFGRHNVDLESPYPYQAMVMAVRDRLLERLSQTRQAVSDNDHRRTAYLSLEFLMGRLFRNTLLNLDLEAPTAAALESYGVALEQLYECEADAGLGNGGLGRLAACFLDSCATLGLPVTGYGIRYHYGMFHQKIVNGYQMEEPDTWLAEGFPWEVKRVEYSQVIRFGGRSEAYKDHAGVLRYRWVDTHNVKAIPYDVPVPGYRNEVVNTLRLWSAEATDEFDLEEFNAGSYADAVAAKNAAENITMVLYPNAETENGQALRLRQQYFLASASLQDIFSHWRSRHGNDFSQFADKNSFQLNDTHPAIAVAELMRLLLDEQHMDWDRAWSITTRTMAYTNHTLLPEALEMWPVSMFSRLLPRLLDIIYEINARFVVEISQKWPGDNDRLRRMSLIQEGHEPMIRMAYLAIVGSYSVNGVAKLHSRLLTEGLFRDFAELWPQKFNNKTNGVTQRRWLAACNPGLTDLISSRIGRDWITDLPQLEKLKVHADDEVFQTAWRRVKASNKERLAEFVYQKTGVQVGVDMLFDVQVKRIHEYKRQLLNVLHAIHLYDRIRRGDGEALVPRAILIGGKAAPGYVMAKAIIKCINNVAHVINSDPDMQDRLKLVFVPDYNVTAMEIICPAAELSEQISTAGKEASGTGNMKFMMNGAITIGTLDGANVEIRDAVGADNFFLFGHTVEEVTTMRQNYQPRQIVEQDDDLKRVVALLQSGHFDRFEPGILRDVVAAILDPYDQWMTVADFRSFVDSQQRANDAYRDPHGWTRTSILNTASSGGFSTDRTMTDYNNDIWRLESVKRSS